MRRQERLLLLHPPRSSSSLARIEDARQRQIKFSLTRQFNAEFRDCLSRRRRFNDQLCFISVSVTSMRRGFDVDHVVPVNERPAARVRDNCSSERNRAADSFVDPQARMYVGWPAGSLTSWPSVSQHFLIEFDLSSSLLLLFAN